MHLWRVCVSHGRIGLLTDLQYRANFVNQLIVSLLSVGLSLGSIFLVFRHTSALGAWTQPDLLLLIGVHMTVRGFIGLFVRPSLHAFVEGVRTGDVDFVLLKPVDSQLYVCLQRFRVWSLFDVLLGVGLILWSAVGLKVAASPGAVLLFLAALGAGCAVVVAFWFVLSVASFWFVRVDNIFVFFDALFDTARWPVTIYPAFLRIALTFVIPVAWAVTVPAALLSGHMTAGALSLAGLVPAGFCLAARLCWQWGLRRYSGASA